MGRSDGSQVGELTSYGLPAVYRPQQQHVSKGLQTNLIWKSGPAQFLTSNFTSPSNVVWDSQGLSGLHDRTSERTHVHGGAVQKLDVEGLARRDGERVDVHGRALDRRSDVIKGRDRARAIGRGRRSDDERNEREECSEAEETSHVRQVRGLRCRGRSTNSRVSAFMYC